MGDRRCETCRHFAMVKYTLNAMRLFGPAKIEELGHCGWTPPAPFWAAPEYRPLAVRENRQRMDSVRQVEPTDGAHCTAWEALPDWGG